LVDSFGLNTSAFVPFSILRESDRDAASRLLPWSSSLVTGIFPLATEIGLSLAFDLSLGLRESSTFRDSCPLKQSITISIHSEIYPSSLLTLSNLQEPTSFAKVTEMLKLSIEKSQSAFHVISEFLNLGLSHFINSGLLSGSWEFISRSSLFPLTCSLVDLSDQSSASESGSRYESYFSTVTKIASETVLTIECPQDSSLFSLFSLSSMLNVTHSFPETNVFDASISNIVSDLSKESVPGVASTLNSQSSLLLASHNFVISLLPSLLSTLPFFISSISERTAPFRDSRNFKGSFGIMMTNSVVASVSFRESFYIAVSGLICDSESLVTIDSQSCSIVQSKFTSNVQSESDSIFESHSLNGRDSGSISRIDAMSDSTIESAVTLTKTDSPSDTDRASGLFPPSPRFQAAPLLVSSSVITDSSGHNATAHFSNLPWVPGQSSALARVSSIHTNTVIIASTLSILVLLLALLIYFILYSRRNKTNQETVDIEMDIDREELNDSDLLAAHWSQQSFQNPDDSSNEHLSDFNFENNGEETLF
jgi:hypothetical protein